MSHHTTVSIEIKDRSALIEALCDVFGEGAVEIHESPAVIKTFSRSDMADIIVRKGAIGQWNGPLALQWGDIGFRFDGKEGEVKAAFDSYDLPIFKRLRQAYAAAVAARKLKEQGWTVARHFDSDGNVVLTATGIGAQGLDQSPLDGIAADQTTVEVHIPFAADHASVAVTGMSGPACLVATQGLTNAMGTVQHVTTTGFDDDASRRPDPSRARHRL